MQTQTITPTEIEKAKESVLYYVKAYENAIHSALNLIGITAWFKAYTQSEEFTKLSNEFKSKAFDTYEDLKNLLNHLDEETDTLTEL